MARLHSTLSRWLALPITYKPQQAMEGRREGELLQVLQLGGEKGMGEAFLLTVGAFLLTAELFHLQSA